ncbi:MAG: excinuclease ABC subunit UvrC [Prevotellaceae bacterium]|jgi:excinuclease ABC subunit C|nr:excinuclease ABC subunit UvrC [Prevotellaceae bacterium]
MDYKQHIETILSALPEKPGCYQFFDDRKTVIYVGKAKNLKRRVVSYFRKDHVEGKTRVLVKQIRDIKYIVVDTEAEALLLENSLIKQNRPRYNVMLKDDKTYPSIVIKNENFPRIFKTRNIVKDGSQYFGPYGSIATAKTMLNMIKTVYRLRTCKLPLSDENIRKGKYRVCLEYHIKRCDAPCTGLVSEAEYENRLKEIREILKGNSSKISLVLMEQMRSLSREMRFEEAQVIKEKYETIENYRARSTVVTPALNNIDVFSFDENEKSAYINYMHIGNGAVVNVYTFEYKKKLEESKEELLGMGIVEMREKFHSDAKEIILPFLPDMKVSEEIAYTIPQKKGDRLNLLELSLQNVRQYKADRLKQSEKFNPEQRTTRLLKTIQTDLHLPVLPMQIECFDNSNIQGANPVAACVVFRKGKPSKKDYRRFHVKTVVGPDDFATMEEIVTRRYTRLLEEEQPLPQLIVIDGGKGQLNIAYSVLQKLNLTDRISIIGLAKRLEEIFYPGDPVPLVLDKTSETLRVIQRLRDEAHRFGITFHRNVRSKKQILSELDSIKGVGEKTKTELLKKYRSVKRIREVSPEELSELVGRKRAEIIHASLHKQ